MDVAGIKAAMIVDNYFEEAEFTQPLEALKKAGMDVRVLGTQSLALQAMRHKKPGGTYQADELLDAANADDYDLIILPGGALNADTLRMNETARQWVRKYLHDNRTVAAICHAPWLLVSAQVLMGRTLTSYYTIQDDIRNAGGEWLDQSVVIDKNLITSRKPDDIADFIQAIIDALRSRREEQLNKEVFDE
jgi:protease I